MSNDAKKPQSLASGDALCNPVINSAQLCGFIKFYNRGTGLIGQSAQMRLKFRDTKSTTKTQRSQREEDRKVSRRGYALCSSVINSAQLCGFTNFTREAQGLIAHSAQMRPKISGTQSPRREHDGRNAGH